MQSIHNVSLHLNFLIHQHQKTAKMFLSIAREGARYSHQAYNTKYPAFSV